MSDATNDADTTDDAEAQNLLADAVGQTGDTKPDTGNDTDWKATAERLTRDVERWKGLARKHEGRAKDNADAASKAQTVEEQLAELRKALAERDVVDVERNGRHAMAQVHTRLAEAGLRRDDVTGLLELVEPTQLLRDGEPDAEAIGKLADSLVKVAGRVTPDPDQGRKGGDGPVDMNKLIRRAAGVTTT